MSDDAMPDNDCQKTIARLYPYLDRELGPGEQAAVRAHLEVCGNCARLFRFEENVLTLVAERLARTVAPAGLRARVMRHAPLDPSARG
jgi:mycothiol system anti-sigma-R factor